MINLSELRIQLEHKMEDLINDIVMPEEAGRWAYDLHQDAAIGKVIDTSPSLSLLFDFFMMCDLKHSENGPYIYSTDSYKEWYNEYKEEYAEEIDKKMQLE